jgi:dienelactone hydrolase
MYPPVLILLGDADDWTPAVRCDVFRSYGAIELKVYKGAPHSFDNPGAPRTYLAMPWATITRRRLTPGTW